MAKVLSLGTLLLYKFPSNPFSILKDGMFGDLFKDFNDFFLGYFLEVFLEMITLT